MSLSRLLLRSFRRPIISPATTASISQASQILIPQDPHPNPNPLHSLIPTRSFAFSSAEEAAAERRRRKRRLRIEPPLHALRRDPSAPRPPPDPNAPRLPDSTSALVGHRLNLHNRVQSLIRAGDLDNASATARQAVFSRTRPTVFTCNAIIAAMFRAKRYDEAVALFQLFFNQSNIVPNVVSYNFLINTHCDCGRVDVGLEIYRHIEANAPFSPSSVTYRHLTKGLIDAERIDEAVDLVREMLTKGHGADSLVYNNLIKGFLDLGDLVRANEFFNELKERCLVYDGVVNATFMDWFFNQGREKEAMESYASLLDRQFRMTPATCNVLLECLLRHGRKKEAWEMFDTMLDNHTPPNFQGVNSDTFSIMVNECFKEGKFSEAVDAFRKVGTKMNSRPFSMDVAGYTNIVVRFVENGMIEDAERFFEELNSKSLSPDVTGYRTLIDAYLKEGRMDDAAGMFQRMVDVNLRVIPLYANRWFTELVENGKAEECAQIITKMGERDPKPDPATYEIVLKGLCGIGSFGTCKDVVRQMMGYGVGVTSAVKEFLVETFEKQGERDEIEKLLDPRRQHYLVGSNGQSSGGPSRQSGLIEAPKPPAGFPNFQNTRFAGSAAGPAVAPAGNSASAGSYYYGQNGNMGYQGNPPGYANDMRLGGQAGPAGNSAPGGSYYGQTRNVEHQGNPGFAKDMRFGGQVGATGNSAPGGANYSHNGNVGHQGNQPGYENDTRFGGSQAGAAGNSTPGGSYYGQNINVGHQGNPGFANHVRFGVQAGGMDSTPYIGHSGEGGGFGHQGPGKSLRFEGFAGQGGATTGSSAATGFYEARDSGHQGPVGSLVNAGLGSFAGQGGVVSSGHYQGGGPGPQGTLLEDARSADGSASSGGTMGPTTATGYYRGGHVVGHQGSEGARGPATGSEGATGLSAATRYYGGGHAVGHQGSDNGRGCYTSSEVALGSGYQHEVGHLVSESTRDGGYVSSTDYTHGWRR